MITLAWFIASQKNNSKISSANHALGAGGSNPLAPTCTIIIFIYNHLIAAAFAEACSLAFAAAKSFSNLAIRAFAAAPPLLFVDLAWLDDALHLLLSLLIILRFILARAFAACLAL